MKTVSKNGLSGIIEAALIALMLVALGLMISLPWSITGVTDRKPGMEGFYYEKYFVVLMFSGLMAELILWQARGIMHNVNVGRPFCRDTVRRLRTIGTGMPGAGGGLFRRHVLCDQVFYGADFRGLFGHWADLVCVRRAVPAGYYL